MYVLRNQFFSIFSQLLTELRSFIICIIRCIIQLWSLFCSVLFYISLHLLPILLIKLGFRLFVFWFFVFQYLWFLVFSFSAPCFAFKNRNIISSLKYFKENIHRDILGMLTPASVECSC